MNRLPLPLTVIGGFLGAGKTTLVNRWLREADGRRLAILVNDFGAINIDAELIESTAADMVALTNGCVCCQIGDDLSAALIRVLEAPAPFDAVVVEASGVSDPWRIAQLGRADPGLRLDSVIVLVDAAAALQQARDPLLADTLQRQLEAADLIVVNKTDLAAPDELGRLHEWIASIAGRTPRLETTRAEVPMALLSGLVPAAERERSTLPPASCAHDHAHDHTHDHAHAHDHDHHQDQGHSSDAGDDPAPFHGEMFDTWACWPRRAFSATALRAWIGDVPEGVLRLKGFLATDDGGWVEIQFAGRHGSVRRAPPATTAAALVAIGLRGRLPMARLDDFFADVEPHQA